MLHVPAGKLMFRSPFTPPCGWIDHANDEVLTKPGEFRDPSELSR
jgi:hypothetical protein